jgi:hypothetical protein
MTLIPAAALATDPPEWLIDKMIPRCSTGLIYGAPYTGKSLVAVEWALGIASGSDVFTRKVIRGAVAYCAGEGLLDLGCRLEARVRRQAVEDVTAGVPSGYASDGVYVATEPFAAPVTRNGDVSRAMEAVITQLADIPGLELVILDPLGRYMAGSAMSNESAAQRAMDGLAAMAARLECTVLAVNHTTKAGDQRGAGPLTASADFVFAVTPETGGQGSCMLTCEKQKYGARFAPMAYDVLPFAYTDPKRDDDGEVIPGETVRVESATVRMRDDTVPGVPSRSRPPAEVPRARKRNGLRAVPDRAAAPRRDLAAALTSVQCPDCSRPGGGMSCDVRYPGSKLIPVSFDPVRAVHADRAVAAWMAGHVTEAELDQVLAAVA